jgi:hypothetical protein
LYNDTEIREFHFVVNGKQPVEGKMTDWRQLKFVAHRCIGADCFPEEAVEAECEPEGDRKWSDPNSWDPEPDPEKRTAFPIPGEGDVFKIPTGWNMEFDLSESPIFDTIEVNGCIHFRDNEDA